MLFMGDSGSWKAKIIAAFCSATSHGRWGLLWKGADTHYWGGGSMFPFWLALPLPFLGRVTPSGKYFVPNLSLCFHLYPVCFRSWCARASHTTSAESRGSCCVTRTTPRRVRRTLSTSRCSLPLKRYDRGGGEREREGERDRDQDMSERDRA